MHRRHAFTLIELLVVVAIIALLVSILLPALGRARDLTKTSVCMAHMRGCMAAFEVYAAEYGGHYPDLFMYDPSKPWTEPFDRAWWTLLVDLDYLATTDFIYCPAYKDTIRTDEYMSHMEKGGWVFGAAWEGSFGMMQFGQSWPNEAWGVDDPFIPEKYVSRPGEECLIFDSINFSPDGNPTNLKLTFDEFTEVCDGEYSDPPPDLTYPHTHLGLPDEDTGNGQAWRGLSIRHGNATNAGFFDGHVEKIDGKTFWEMEYKEPGTIWDGF